MNRDQFVEKLKSQLDEINEDVDALEARVEAAGDAVSKKYREQLDEAKAQRATAEQKLAGIRAAGDDAWEDLKGDAEHTWKAFKQSVNYFKSQLK